MKCKYLLQYTEEIIPNGFSSSRNQDKYKTCIKVKNLTDSQLEEFCKDKIDIKVQFLCKYEEEKVNWDDII